MIPQMTPQSSDDGSYGGIAYAVWIGVAALAVYVLIAAEDLLIPLAIAVGVWYLINALSQLIGLARFGKLALPGWIRKVIALGAILGFFYGVGSLIGDNIEAASQDLPQYRANLEQLAAQLEAWTGIPIMEQADTFFEDLDLGTWAADIANAVGTVAGTTGLIIIYVFFLLIEQATFDRKLDRLFTRPDRRERVRRTLATIQRRVMTYLWVKTLMSLFTGGLSYAILKYVDLDYAEFWAFIIFLLNYIPTLGSLAGIVFPVLMSLVQFSEWEPILIVLVGISTIQVTIGNLVEPRLMGTSLNISPLMVILSLALWGAIWGVTGLFLGVPIMVVLIIVLSQFEATKGVAIVMSANGDVISPTGPGGEPERDKAAAS